VRAGRALALFTTLLSTALPRVGSAQSQPAAEKAFTEGQALVAAKKPDEAAEKFQAVVDAEPTFAPGWYALAAARRRAGQCSKAVPAYRRYAEMQPQEIEPYYGLGLCLREGGDKKGAAEALAHYVAEEKRPTSQRWVEHARSVLAELAGDVPASGPATPVAPKPAVARSTPSTPKTASSPPAHGASPSEAPAGAEAGGARASAAAGPYADAQSLRDRGHIDEAIAKFRQAISADPTHMAARAALGELFLKIRRDDEAISVFRNAVERNPGYPLAWYELGFALRIRGRLSESIEAYQHYIKLRPTDPDPYFGLARALQKLGRNQAAVNAYQTYVSMEKRPTEQKWVHAAEAQIRVLAATAATH
jgi:tetratricopeptide (TPR) repeat protein